jgi:hypothetical protein
MSVLLTKAIVDRIRQDSVLADLTTHSDGDIRIARDDIITKPKCPFLGIGLNPTYPLVPNAVTELQRGWVLFRAYSKDDVTCIRIADRVSDLLHAVGDRYLDFTNNDILNSSTVFKSRLAKTFNAAIDTWFEVVKAEVIWSPK